MILHSASSSYFTKGQYRTDKVPPINRLSKIYEGFPPQNIIDDTQSSGVDIVFDIRFPSKNEQSVKSPSQNQPLHQKEFKTAAGLPKEQASLLEKAKQDLQIQKVVAELKVIDTEVRQHEQAHMAAGAGLITRGATYTHTKGPDGKEYAVGGEVGIDSSAVSGDPETTIQKMQQVKAAAMAPARPSGQDLAVAAAASAQEAQALAELAQSRLEEQTSEPNNYSPEKLDSFALQNLNKNVNSPSQNKFSQEHFNLTLNAQANIISRIA
ncbi:MAG: putative metalloprotease CJM1_0395 family protein [Treponemataceae bacterium]